MRGGGKYFQVLLPAYDNTNPGLRLAKSSEEERGLIVSHVHPGGKAQLVGLKVGDILEVVNGIKIARMETDQAEHLLRQSNGKLLLGITRHPDADVPQTNVAAVESLPTETFDTQSTKEKNSEKKSGRFRNKFGRLKTNSEGFQPFHTSYNGVTLRRLFIARSVSEKPTSSSSESSKLKTRKSLREQWRSFLNRLFRTRKNQTSSSFEKRPTSTLHQSFSSTHSSSKQDKRAIKIAPHLDIAVSSPNNAFQTKSSSVTHESRPHSNSLSMVSRTSSVKSAGSSSPKATINISPTLRVVSITPTDQLDRSTTTTSDDCVVLSFTQTEVPTRRDDPKSVQSSVISKKDVSKVSSTHMVHGQIPSSSHHHVLKSSDYSATTVTPSSNLIFVPDATNYDDHSTFFGSAEHHHQENKNVDLQVHDASFMKVTNSTSAEKSSTAGSISANSFINSPPAIEVESVNLNSQSYDSQIRYDGPDLVSNTKVNSMLLTDSNNTKLDETSLEKKLTNNRRSEEVLKQNRLETDERVDGKLKYENHHHHRVGFIQTVNAGEEVQNDKLELELTSENNNVFPIPPIRSRKVDLAIENEKALVHPSHNEKELEQIFDIALKRLRHDGQPEKESSSFSSSSSALQKTRFGNETDISYPVISVEHYNERSSAASHPTPSSRVQESRINYDLGVDTSTVGTTPYDQSPPIRYDRDTAQLGSHHHADYRQFTPLIGYDHSGITTYSSFFSKEPLILYSRNSLQKGGEGEVLSPDSGISSVQSPASLKSFTTNVSTTASPAHYSSVPVVGAAAGDAGGASVESIETADRGLVKYQNIAEYHDLNKNFNQSQDRYAVTLDLTQIKLQPTTTTSQSSVIGDGRLVNIVSPTTPYSDSQKSFSESEKLESVTTSSKQLMKQNYEDANLTRCNKPITLEREREREIILSTSEYVNSNLYSNDSLQRSHHQTHPRNVHIEANLPLEESFFPSVPPPSYRSVVYEGDPLDMSRFTEHQASSNSSSRGSQYSTSMQITTPKRENIYDFIPAAAASSGQQTLTSRDDGIYEQIPFHQLAGGGGAGEDENVVKMTIEPTVDHIEFSFKPIHLHLSSTNLHQATESHASCDQLRTADFFGFPPMVKSPIQESRANEELKRELKEKLRNVGSIEDKFAIIKEEYLGHVSPSQASYKPHHPQTFSPTQTTHDVHPLHSSLLHNRGRITLTGNQSGGEPINNGYTYEGVMEIERQKRKFKERLESEQTRHVDYYSSLEKSPLSSGEMKEVLLYDNIEPPQSQKVTNYKGKARALYNFKAQKPRELSLRKGEIVYLLRRVDKNWFEGGHRDRIGIFPVTYVEVLETIEEAHSIARMREGSATVLYDFYPRSPAELPLKKGYVVTLIKRVDHNWYEGRCGTQQGIFPVAYVSTIREPDSPLPTPCATPIPTPSASRIHTPLPGSTPGWQSPSAASILSLNPDVPSAPRSPTEFSSCGFSRESTPFGGSVIAAPAYRPQHRSSSVMSEPVQMRDVRIFQPKPIALPPQQYSFVDSKVPVTRLNPPTNIRYNSLRPVRDGRNSKDNYFYDNLNSTKNTFNIGNPSATRSLDRARCVQSSCVELRAPATFTSLKPKPNPSISNDAKTMKKKSTKLTFAPIPEKEVETDGIKPIIYPRYRVLHDFKPRSPEELELQRDEVVRVVEKCRDGWYIGFLESTRQFGLFPGNFVEPVRL